jgi:leader peptidase (prepilin peptidase)/N-methyltransferase
MEHVLNYFLGGAIFVFGLIIGSFLNVVIARVPDRENIVFPGSHCPSCGAPIKPYDNIPVLSYLLLRGRCRSCNKGISPVYPLVELLVACLYLLFFLMDGFTLRLLADLIFASFIVPLTFIDLRHQLLPDPLTLPGLAVAALLRLMAPDAFMLNRTRSIFGLWQTPDWAVSLVGSALGAAVGAGILWVVMEVYLRIRHHEGMGPGDVKMMLMVGAFLGWERAMITIFLASLGGSVIGLAMMSVKKASLKTALPFGVFLGPASLVTLAVGEKFLRWYITLLRY